jgi:hypothetical protein
MPTKDHRPDAPVEPDEVTPEMIEAGASELRDYVQANIGPDFRKELAAAVYEAMEIERLKAL